MYRSDWRAKGHLSGTLRCRMLKLVQFFRPSCFLSGSAAPFWAPSWAGRPCWQRQVTSLLSSVFMLLYPHCRIGFRLGMGAVAAKQQVPSNLIVRLGNSQRQFSNEVLSLSKRAPISARATCRTMKRPFRLVHQRLVNALPQAFQGLLSVAASTRPMSSEHASSHEVTARSDAAARSIAPSSSLFWCPQVHGGEIVLARDQH